MNSFYRLIYKNNSLYMNEKEKEADMVSKNEEEVKTMTDDECSEVLNIINMLKHSDVSDLMMERREPVFNRVMHKISSEYKPERIAPNKKTIIYRYLLVASVALILLLSSTIATYHIGFNSAKNVSNHNQITVNAPYGMISTVTMSDGTTARLNSGSTLSYPAIFGKERQVYLSGEGYFDVVKDDKSPFVVNSKTVAVKVLGTRFAFKAYDNDERSVITLEEGSVKVVPLTLDIKGEIILSPNQQLIIDNKTSELRRRIIKAEEYTSWKDGILYFRDASLGEISKVLERSFNVKIIITSDDLVNENYVAQFKYGENVEQILEKLSYKHSWYFIKDKDTIEIVKTK